MKTNDNNVAELAVFQPVCHGQQGAIEALPPVTAFFSTQFSGL
jgi:hypothetical protein